MDTVGLIINTYNRGQYLKNSLERLCKLTKPDNIVVIGDGDTDNTEEVVNLFKNRLPIRYIYNHQPNYSICSIARNIGVKQLNTDIIITSEPEVIWITDVINQFLKIHEENPMHVITAGTVYHQQKNTRFTGNILIDNPTEQLNKAKILKNAQGTVQNKYDFVQTVNWQATWSAFYRKNWIIDVGGFDEEFPSNYSCEDIDICTRIRIKLGINQIINKDIKVIHQWHGHPNLGNSTVENMNYMLSKGLSKDGIEDKTNPFLIANKNKEWGIIKTR